MNHCESTKSRGRLALVAGNNGLPKLDITTDTSTAEIYLNGAHVTAFQKKGEPPLLFLSRSSQFTEGKPIRGGVPLVFPWFGPREAAPAHGFARLSKWILRETKATPEGGVRVLLELSDTILASNGLPAQVTFAVTVNDTLTMELTTVNRSTSTPLVFEDCLHTYFAVGDINEVSISGLKGVTCLDKVGLVRVVEKPDAIRIQSEVDRVYLDTAATVDIHDTRLRRKIRVEKSGSASTVVWNPWGGKSKQMPDLGDEEYKQMVCVESGNVAENKITLPPGKSATLKVILSSLPV